MHGSSILSIMTEVVGASLVASTTLPAFFIFFKRFGSGKERGYRRLYVLYNDVDGKASEESQKRFSTLAARLVALVATVLGLFSALAYAVLVTLRWADTLVEGWVRVVTLVCNKD